MVRFGTDGIRGPAGRHPITPDVGRAVGAAAARRAREVGTGRVLVGRDTRPSGAELAAAVLDGAAGAGARAGDAGVVPTSAVGLALAAGLADVGVVVTASHNAAPDNGFKVLDVGGDKLSGAAREAFEARLSADLQPSITHASEDRSAEIRAAWAERIRTAAGPLKALRGLRLAVDLAHGAASGLAEALRALTPETEWVVVGAGDGTINDGVGSEHLGALGAAVRAAGCAGGFAVDGDADRCRLVDASGAPVHGDAVAWLLARTRGAAGLAVTVMSTASLEPSLPGIRVVRTPVGDQHLRAAMRAERLDLGSEESGHVLFADLEAGDGVLTGLRALEAALAGGRTVAAAVAPFAVLPRRVAKVAVCRRPPLDEVPGLVEATRRGEASLGEGGRVFLRYSGTEPVLRVLVEGPDPAVVARVAEQIAAAAEEALS